MTVKVKNKSGITTMILNADFNQILEDNFAEICKAIAIKGQMLKELTVLMEKDPEAINLIYQTVQSSCGEEEAVNNLQKKIGISKETAFFLLNMSLEQLVSINETSIKKSLAEYKKHVAVICSIH